MSPVSIHAEVIGQGKPVLFLPSGDFTGIQGRQLAERMGDSYGFHLLDLPGIGQSKGMDKPFSIRELAQWLKSYIDAQRFNKVSIIAHSLGGMAAIAFAFYFPERVDKLILLDVGHKFMGKFPIDEFGLLGILLPGISLIHKLLPRFINRSLARLFSSPGNITDSMKHFYEGQHLAPNQYIEQMFASLPVITPAGINLYMLYFRTKLPKFVQELKVSTLLVWADFAGINEKEAAKSQQAAEDIQNDFVMTRKVASGHFVQFKEAGLQYIAHFLKEGAEKCL